MADDRNTLQMRIRELPNGFYDYSDPIQALRGEYYKANIEHLPLNDDRKYDWIVREMTSSPEALNFDALRIIYPMTLDQWYDLYLKDEKEEKRSRLPVGEISDEEYSDFDDFVPDESGSGRTNYLLALAQYNKNSDLWCNPKQGSKEHKDVKELEKKLFSPKPKSSDLPPDLPKDKKTKKPKRPKRAIGKYKVIKKELNKDEKNALKEKKEERFSSDTVKAIMEKETELGNGILIGGSDNGSPPPKIPQSSPPRHALPKFPVPKRPIPKRGHRLIMQGTNYNSARNLFGGPPPPPPAPPAPPIIVTGGCKSCTYKPKYGCLKL